MNDAVPHSLTYTPDAAQGLVQLAERESAWNQTWHVPTTPNPLTGKEFVALAAKEFGVAPKYRVLSRPMLRLAGWFDPLVAESYEMLYQSDSPYLFDSGKFARSSVLPSAPTPTASERLPTPSSATRSVPRTRGVVKLVVGSRLTSELLVAQIEFLEWTGENHLRHPQVR